MQQFKITLITIQSIAQINLIILGFNYYIMSEQKSPDQQKLTQTNNYYSQSLAKNRQIMMLLEKGQIDASIDQLKQLYNQVLQKHQKQDLALLQKLQIIILTNLACAYRKKQKYNISLFYLKNVQQLQAKINISEAEAGSTYSNLCAIYSEMGKHRQAYREIRIGIKKLEKSLLTKYVQQVVLNLIVSYHNCAIQCQYLTNYSLALDYAEKGIEYCQKLKLDSEVEIVLHLKETIQRVNQKKNKVQMKFSKFYEKQYKQRIYFKNREDLDQTFEVKKKDNLAIEVTRRMLLQKKVTPFPHIMAPKRNLSLNTHISDKKVPELSAYYVPQIRDPSRNKSTYGPITYRTVKQELPYLGKTRSKSGDKDEKSIENNILEYSKTKPKLRSNFRQSKFQKS